MHNIDQLYVFSNSFYEPSRRAVLKSAPKDVYQPQQQQVAYPTPPSSRGPSPVSFHTQQPVSATSPARPKPLREVPRISHLPSPPPTPTHFEDSWPTGPTYFDPGQRLQYRQTLGSGAYGVVHLAQDVVTHIPYAVKVLNKFNAEGMPLDQRQQNFQRTEMHLHYEVSAHPNIVSLLRILDVADCTYVVMEYCPEGDLFSNITERGRYVGDDHAAKDAFLQILDAVSHCHRLGVYHRDLKPENILLTQGGNQVKLADFGLATTDKYSRDFGCGSTFYMSPECHNQSSGLPYYACAPNDIWSLGVILVNLTCGRNPWKQACSKDSTFKAYMQDRQFLKSILPLSDELNEILGMIFEVDPTRRITIDELRLRIINCAHFTKKAADAAAAHTDTINEDFTYYEEPLSKTSTISEEGSMISDRSADSTVPSESDTASEYGSSFEVMDEDHNLAYQEVFPGELSTSKIWCHDVPFTPLGSSYLSVDSTEASIHHTKPRETGCKLATKAPRIVIQEISDPGIPLY